jgi:prephenate dehydrogenase
MDGRRHDDLLALTSHLPHLLAFSLFSLVSASARRDRRVRALVAGSFRDMTRVAGSNPDIWTGIFDLNRRALGRAMDGFSRAVRALQGSSAAALNRRLRALVRDKKSWSA